MRRGTALKVGTQVLKVVMGVGGESGDGGRPALKMATGTGGWAFKVATRAGGESCEQGRR